MSDPTHTPRKTVRMNPAHVRPPKPDPRGGKRDQVYIQTLAKDIMTRGLRNPPYVRMVDGVPTIVVGEHRRLALVSLGLAEAEFNVLEGELTATQMAIEQWQEAALHAKFTPMQKAALVQDIMRAEKLSRREFCERHGDALELDEPKLSKLLRVNGICPGLHQAVESGELGASISYLVATLPDCCQGQPVLPAACIQREFAMKCLSGEWKRDVLSRKVKEALKKDGGAKKAKPVAMKTEGGLLIEAKPDMTVGQLLAAHSEWIERVKKCAKKDDFVESLPFLLKRGA